MASPIPPSSHAATARLMPKTQNLDQTELTTFFGLSNARSLALEQWGLTYRNKIIVVEQSMHQFVADSLIAFRFGQILVKLFQLLLKTVALQ